MKTNYSRLKVSHILTIPTHSPNNLCSFPKTHDSISPEMYLHGKSSTAFSRPLPDLDPGTHDLGENGTLADRSTRERERVVVLSAQAATGWKPSTQLRVKPLGWGSTALGIPHRSNKNQLSLTSKGTWLARRVRVGTKIWLPSNSAPLMTNSLQSKCLL